MYHKKSTGDYNTPLGDFSLMVGKVLHVLNFLGELVNEFKTTIFNCIPFL